MPQSISIHDFINLLKKEFDFGSHENIDANRLLKDAFGDSSLNLLFLRGVISDNFDINLTDDEIKNCITVESLYLKIIQTLESKSP